MSYITIRELLTSQLREIGADGLIIEPDISECECTIDHDLLACDGFGVSCVAAKRGLDGELHPMEKKMEDPK